MGSVKKREVSSLPTFKDTAPEQTIHEIAMPLIAYREGVLAYASGTAFVVGRGYAITAYHVIQDFATKFEGKRDIMGKNLEFDTQIFAYLTLKEGKELLPIRILKIWASAPLDLALLAFGVPSDFPNEHRWKVPILQLLPPKVGTPICGFGFAESVISKKPEGSIPELKTKPVTTTGKVIEIHHEIRDDCRLPFPCFRTNARFDGGMSGGPIFNAITGHICGVICSSLPATTDEEDHISYASSLWPIVGSKCDASRIHFSGADPYPVFKLFEKGIIRANDFEKVLIATNEMGQLTPIANYSRSEWDTYICIKAPWD